jgi:hypothetical protein
MVVARNLLLVLHIISAGTLITSFPLGFILTRMSKAAQGPAVGIYAGLRGELSGILGQIGGIGILITGLGLIGIDKYGFLGIGGATPTWLVIKQIIYIVLLVISLGVLTPMSIRIRTAMAAARGAGAPPAEVQAMIKRATMLGYLMNLLVFINICLAVWKQPF